MKLLAGGSDGFVNIWDRSQRQLQLHSPPNKAHPLLCAHPFLLGAPLCSQPAEFKVREAAPMALSPSFPMCQESPSPQKLPSQHPRHLPASAPCPEFQPSSPLLRTRAVLQSAWHKLLERSCIQRTVITYPCPATFRDPLCQQLQSAQKPRAPERGLSLLPFPISSVFSLVI